MELPNFSGPSSGPASGFVVHTPALLIRLFLRSAFFCSYTFATGLYTAVISHILCGFLDLHVNITMSLIDVVHSALDAVLVRHIHDQGDNLTPSRSNLV